MLDGYGIWCPALCADDRIRVLRIFSFAVPVPNSANQRHSPCLVWAEGVNCPMRDREPVFDLLAVEVSSSAELFDKCRLPDGTLGIDEPKGEPPVSPQYCFILRFSTRSLHLHAPEHLPPGVDFVSKCGPHQ
ncbi:hypothetical protein DIPPA_34590 [Diplonema papillatum]|nr:hypothetical protein DIPPA_34590 [Diplonema papillatum]